MNAAYLHFISICLRGGLILLLLGGSLQLVPIYAQLPIDSLTEQDEWTTFIESQLQVGLMSEDDALAATMLYDERRWISMSYGRKT